MEQIDWNAKVKEALERTNIMALSTIGEEGSWTNPVHFNYDSSLVLSFKSKMHTKHVQNILKDPRVSVAIYKPEPFPEGGNLGLQIRGTAKAVGPQNEAGYQTFEITPEEVGCFDSRIAHERHEIDLKDLKL